MTLIAAFTVGDTPVIVGDIVISGPETENSQPIHIPTIGMSTEVFPEGSGWIISDVCQKVAIIGGNIMIAMAGSYVAGRTVIKALKERNEQAPFTESHLHNFFIEAKEWVAKQEVYFIGFIQDNNEIKPFCYSFNGANCLQVNSSRYGSVTLCGSGMPDMQDLMHFISSQQSLSSTKSFNGFHKAVSEALALCGVLYTREMGTQNSLMQYYGGAYEIALWNGEKFQKLQEITYLTWLVENKKLALAPKFFKVSYVRDILLVYILNFDGKWRTNGDTTCYGLPDENIRIQPIEPIYRNLDDEELDSVRVSALDSQYYCNTLVFSTEDTYRLSVILKNEGLYFLPTTNPKYMEVNNSLLSRIIELSELL